MFFKLVKILLAWCGWDSTMFLLGPAKQLRTMCDPERWFACTIYFCSLFFTLFSALKVKPKLPSYYIKLILSTNGVVQNLLLLQTAADVLRLIDLQDEIQNGEENASRSVSKFLQAPFVSEESKEAKDVYRFMLFYFLWMGMTLQLIDVGGWWVQLKIFILTVMAILIELCAVAWYIHQTSIVENWIYRTPKPQDIALILTQIRLAYTDAYK